LYDLSSDHSPLLLTLNIHPLSLFPRPTLINGPVDYKSFETFLNNNITLKISLKTQMNIDDAEEKLTSLVQQDKRRFILREFTRTTK
jgi:hypothetical protein